MGADMADHLTLEFAKPWRIEAEPPGYRLYLRGERRGFYDSAREAEQAAKRLLRKEAEARKNGGA